MKNIVSIGAGYVGTPTMAVCAKHCPEYTFICVDHNPRLIEQWNSDTFPIYEPGLEAVIKSVRNINLFFSTDISSAIKQADIIFISVCTPTKTFGIGSGMACDLSYFDSVAKTIRDVSETYKVIVEKSTVPVGTGTHIQKILDSNTKGIKYDIVSNPEFLAEGTAINDLEHPCRVLVGCNNSPQRDFAVSEIVNLYRHWIPEDKIITTDRWSSELSKLVANAFLAQRVSSINSISALCEKTGGDINDVSKIIGMDQRIGKYFLNSSVGFGGSCFQKDVLDLVYLCEYYHLPEVARYWKSVIDINEFQKYRFAKNIIHVMYDSVKNRHLTILGFSFKKDTGDTRESPAINVCQYLLAEGAILHIYDPKVTVSRIKEDLHDTNQLVIEQDPYKACLGSEAIIILTAWDLFHTLDYHRIYNTMEHPSYIFDGCHMLSNQSLKEIGYEVHGLGQYIY